MKPLTSNMHDTLHDLYYHAESEGNFAIFYPVLDVHHMTLKALQRRDLIDLKANYPDAGRVQWYAKITGAGQTLVMNDNTGDNSSTVINDSGARKLKTIQLQLDENKSDHIEAIDTTATLKSNRAFTQTIVNLLKLHKQLIRGDISLLCELYPQVSAALGDAPQTPPAAPQTSGAAVAQFERIFERLDKLDKLDDLEAMMQRQPVASTGNGGGLKKIGGNGSSGGLKSLGAPQLDAPDFDDEDDSALLTVKKSTGNGSNSAQNLINSIMALDNL